MTGKNVCYAFFNTKIYYALHMITYLYCLFSIHVNTNQLCCRPLSTNIKHTKKKVLVMTRDRILVTKKPQKKKMYCSYYFGTKLI